MLLGNLGFGGLFRSVVEPAGLTGLLGLAGIVYGFASAFGIPGVVGVLDLNSLCFAGGGLCLCGSEISVNGVVWSFRTFLIV